MKNHDFTLASGAKIHITPAQFQQAIALSKARMRCLKGLGENMTQFESALAITTSDELEEAFFECAKSSTYNDVRISRSLFDDPKIGEQARIDYMEILKRIIEVNCEPFFPLAASRSARNGLTQTENQP